MSIVTATIEPNGWVLSLTLNASAGTFASYALDPDGTRKLTLASAHAGYDMSGGVAVANAAKLRAFVGTKPLRKLITTTTTSGTPIAPLIDETDLGGGQIKVRIALSRTVYATDSAMTLAVLAGWRTGELAASGIAVTNNSTVVAPIPIFRWIDVPYQRNANGQIKLSLLVASHHPQGKLPVAAVKFTVTDSAATVKTLWATALATSTTYGDKTRCYEVTVDVTTAVALVAGLLRCDAEVYPWIGTMRSTDTAGTRSFATLVNDASKQGAANPFVVAYDPAGTRYANKFIHVDPRNGTATTANITRGATAAAAKAGTHAYDIASAYNAIYADARSLDSTAFGGTSNTRAGDGYTIVLAATTHAGFGTTAVGAGPTSEELWINLIGDPTDANPRGNCILAPTGPIKSLNVAGRSRLKFANLKVQLTSGTGLLAMRYWWWDNCTIEGAPGSKTATTQYTNNAITAGEANHWCTRSRFWGYGINWTLASPTTGPHPLLIRACETTQANQSILNVSNKWIGASDPDCANGIGVVAFSSWAGITTAKEHAEDTFVAFNDARGIFGICYAVTSVPAAIAGTTLSSQRRHVLMGNVFERAGANASIVHIHQGYGENTSLEMSYNIDEGNTIVGERRGIYYSDPVPTSLADVNSQTNLAYCNRFANNADDITVCKTDNFGDDTTMTYTTALPTTDGRHWGYRPACIGTWSAMYGVDQESNVDFGRYSQVGLLSTPYRFQEYFGLGGTQINLGAIADAKYTADYSSNGTQAGMGDYRPVAGSLLIGRARTANTDTDLNAVVRGVTFASGAFEGIMTDTALVPDGARHSMTATATTVGWQTSLAPAASILPQRATESAVLTNGALQPDSALQALTDSGAVLIPDSIELVINALIVSGELRIVYVPRS
jgi:hypothetical protein